MSRTTTVGRFLLRRLSEAGITHLFGVPGDYNLELLDELERCARLEWVGNCNELNAAYAADGFSRIHGVAAVLVTYGVGTLSALNGIAGAYAEQVPLVAITGAPPLAEIERRALLHHTLATGDFENVMSAMRKFTVAQTFLEPSNAVAEIDRVLRACLLKKRPIHIELPSDVASVCVEEPEEAFQPPLPTSDERSLNAFIQDALTALRRAKSPALLVDACVDRFGLREQLHLLLRTSGLPIASMVSAKGTVDEQHAHYIGLYTGQRSDSYVRETIEGSDSLLTFGVQLTDAATAGFSHTIDPTRTINVDPYSARINGTYYAAVTMRDITERLNAELTVPLPSVSSVRSLSERKNQRPATASFQDGTITHDWFWPRIQRFLRPNDILVADNGTSLSGVSGLMLPSGASVVSQPLWASIGYTLPAVLGTLLAAPDRRQLLFIGDGSFQMTAQELSTILRHDLKATIFLINNDGYTIERLILGESSSYNDIQPWRYAELCRVFDPLDRAQSFCVTTRQQMEDVLTLAEVSDRLTFVEVVMDRMDAPQSLKALGPVYAELAYGPLFE